MRDSAAHGENMNRYATLALLPSARFQDRQADVRQFGHSAAKEGSAYRGVMLRGLGRFDQPTAELKLQFGIQATVPGLPIVVVDAALYVEYMPMELKYMTQWFHEGKPNVKTGLPVTWEDVERAIEARKPYAMKRHGDISNKEHNRGDQRFTYPDPKTYMAYDPATDKRIQPSKNQLRGSVTIHPHPEVVRHLQRHAWGTAEWKTVYGQRNQVESVNKSIKHTRFTDLESAAKRPGRGEAYHSIATALMVVACAGARDPRGMHASREEASQIEEEVQRLRPSERPTGDRPGASPAGLVGTNRSQPNSKIE